MLIQGLTAIIGKTLFERVHFVSDDFPIHAGRLADHPCDDGQPVRVLHGLALPCRYPAP